MYRIKTPHALTFIILLSSLLATSSSTSLIQSICKATTNYSLCISTLNSNSNTLKANNIKDLTKISISISLSHATNSSSYILSLIKNKTNADQFSSVLRACARRYGDARDSLKYAVDALDDEEYDYAALHVGGAEEYPGMCRALFRGSLGLSYPVEIERREREFVGLCQLSLDLVSLLIV